MSEEEEQRVSDAFDAVIRFLIGLGYTRDQMIEMGPEEAYEIARLEYLLLS